MPLRKTRGTNTAKVVSTELINADITSLTPEAQASKSGIPSDRFLLMLSRTMIALSINIPSPSARPLKEITLIEIPAK